MINNYGLNFLPINIYGPSYKDITGNTHVCEVIGGTLFTVAEQLTGPTEHSEEVGNYLTVGVVINLTPAVGSGRAIGFGLGAGFGTEVVSEVSKSTIEGGIVTITIEQVVVVAQTGVSEVVQALGISTFQEIQFDGELLSVVGSSDVGILAYPDWNAIAVVESDWIPIVVEP